MSFFFYNELYMIHYYISKSIAQKLNSKNICYWVNGDKEFIPLLTYTLFEPYSVLRPLDNSFLTWHLLVLLTYILVHMLTFLKSQSLHHRNRTELTPENLKHLENVFRENLAKDKDEFTLAEFKKIVPSKNVIHFILLYYYLQP